MVISTLFFISCSKPKNPVIPNEQEVITTVNLTLVPTTSGTPTVVLSFRDLDGDGGNAPVITGGDLAANTTYTGTIEFLNEQNNAVEDITEEIEEEGDEHQLFYQSTVGGITISYNDQDGNGRPIGLNINLATTNTGTGNLIIILRHQPDKSATSVSNGDITNAGGETDIEVEIPINVI